MFLILLLFLSPSLKGQFYAYGQDGGNLKWSQFRTPHYQVIFPRELDSVAEAFARRLEYYYPHLGQPLDHAHSFMPVVIHNESSFSNGVFVWAPKRLEIFTNPDPNGYHQDWLTQLALHEGRHAVQIDKLNQGITKRLSVLGGQQVAGAMAGFLPYWYLEGDAVDAETRLSPSGRGRQPSFEMGLKAQLLAGDGLYSYSKATLGSYKDYVPNHYELGYLMVRHGRRTYGDAFWTDFQTYAARKPYLVVPTHFSMKQYGIRSRNQFYREALESYRSHWEETASRRTLTGEENWTPKTEKEFTSYTFPHLVSDSLALAYKRSLGGIPELVYIGRDGREERIHRPGYLSSGRISQSGSSVVWDEFVPDARWSNRNYSVLKLLDLPSGRVRSLGHKTRLYSPALSRDGTRIVAVEQGVDQKFHLVVLDLEGKVLSRAGFPGGNFLQHPAWMDGDSALVVFVSGPAGKDLYACEPGSGRWRPLFSAGFDDVSYPVVSGTRVFFNGAFDGIDNIYCHDTATGKTSQLSSTRFGAFQPAVSPDGQTLAFARYGPRGFDLVSLPLADARDHREQVDYASTPEEQRVFEHAPDMDPGSDTLDLDIRPYRKIPNLVHVHSWLPLYFDYLNPDLSLTAGHLPVDPGVSLVSQNLLSTAISQAGYAYRGGYHTVHSGIQFRGRYPVTNLYVDVGGEPNVLLLAEGDSTVSSPANLRFTGQVYVPLRLNTGKYLSLVQPRIDYTFRRDVQYDEATDGYRVGGHYLHYSLVATSYLRMGSRDLLPRLGITANAGYYHAPGSLVYGSVTYATTSVYLPGLLKHHSLKLSHRIQTQSVPDMTRPAFLNLIAQPRGRTGLFAAELRGVSADYVFPVFCPDWELGPLLYIKRLRAGVWAERMAGQNVVIREPHPHYEDRTYRSVGFDLNLDFHLLRISFPISSGARFIYLPDEDTWRVEWLYSIDIS
ncbi:MAG: hypothetical protein R2751_11065 [Bacteroidales bacterium]